MDENIVFEENEFEYAEDFAPAEAYHASIQSEIDGINAPVETKDTLGKANEGLKSHMERFQEAEKIYGPYPEVWNSFEPQHRDITANIRNVGEQYQNNAMDEAKAEATERAIFSINASSDYFIKQHEILLKREELHRKEMQEIRQQLQNMQLLLNNSQNLTVGAAFLQAADTLRKEAHSLKDRTVGKAYKNARNAVHEVHDRIVNAPAELRDAVNQKVTETRDRAVTAVVNKVTGIFKKGISFLEKISNKVAAMAPQEQVQEDFGRNLSDLALPVGVLAVKPSLTPNEKEILTSFYISERDRLEEGFMNTLGKSKILMEEEGDILRDTVNVMIKDGLSNDRIKMVMANMPFNKDRLEMNHDNFGFSLNKYLESDVVKKYRDELKVVGFGSKSGFIHTEILPPSAIQVAKRKEIVDMVKTANVSENEKKLVAANDEKKKNDPGYETPDISKLAKADKLTPKEMEYLIGYYQMRNNQLEASILDKSSDSKLTTQELGYIKKDLADIMLKDGLSDSRISIISHKMTSRHPVFPSPVLRPKDEFNLRNYLKSDEAKRIRQSGLAEREKVTKKAAVR